MKRILKPSLAGGYLQHRRILIAFLGFVGLGIFSGALSANENGKGASVTLRPISETLSVSRKIDELVAAGLKKRNLQANDPISDEVFVRRVYLDIAGRIPSYAETVEFLEESSGNKRQHLIDQLLDSKGFVSHQFNYFADLLRIKSRLRNVPGQPFIDFVKKSIRENRPYDQFVRDMLTASGNYAERGHGAVGYYLRDFGMPEDNMSNTVRIFLGTRLECAQCHDHPFDVWTQKDYFEMVAFTGGVMMRVDPPFENANELRQMQRKGQLPEETRRNLQRMLRPLSYGVQGSGTGLARLPKDYQEADGEPNEIVKARTMFEKKELVEPVIAEVGKKGKKRRQNPRDRGITGAKQVNSREAYAEWMTSAENPRFSTVIANRMWKRAMGVGLIEPVDILTDETVPSNPELMNYLSSQMVEMNFDLKQFLRAVYNSHTYQRSASVSDDEELTEFSFRGPLLRRLTGEQLWDSLMTLAVDKIDDRSVVNLYNRQYQGMDIYEIYETTKGMSADEIVELANMSKEEIRKKQRSEYDKQQAKLNAERKQAAAEYKSLQKKIQKARQEKDYATQKKLKAQLIELVQKNRKKSGRNSRDMVRASEMSSPARPGHLVREFGQSDREQIENSNSEPAVTQVLSLMNGYIETRIASNPNTQLMINIQNQPSTEAKIDAVFLSILNRRPTVEERETWKGEAAKYGKTVAADLIWTLVNNSEFLFIQ
ncbi:MAG: DUF1549 domain-containing protein [Planctomycetota bacterium]|nr:DUF1549 domain-containing protein [Planctomycetota bacterium]